MKGRRKRIYDIDTEPPPIPESLRSLPKKCLTRLRRDRLSEIKPKSISLIMDYSRSRKAKTTRRRSSFYVADDKSILFLCWRIKEPVFTERLQRTSWIEVAGDIRDQGGHVNCWAYVAADLVSSLRVIRGFDEKFSPLCTWYLTRNVEPESLGIDENARNEHVCYGSHVPKALAHISEKGIPKERHSYYNCKMDPPTSSETNLKIKSFCAFESLNEALAHLHIQPIGATLAVFKDMWNCKDIYYGPLVTKLSPFEGYHAVLIVGVEKFDGELVAVCKMSNGESNGDKGYIRVSLSVMYMVVGADYIGAKKILGTPEPEHLLTRFCYPIMDNIPPEDIPKRLEDIPKRSEERCRRHGSNSSIKITSVHGQGAKRQRKNPINAAIAQQNLSGVHMANMTTSSSTFCSNAC